MLTCGVLYILLLNIVFSSFVNNHWRRHGMGKVASHLQCGSLDHHDIVSKFFGCRGSIDIIRDACEQFAQS